MNWFDCLLAFQKVCECHSFIGAARQLKITNSAVTKRVQWLEENLACDLFLRSTRKINLTDAGKHLLDRIQPLLEEWRDIHQQLQDLNHQPHGELTVCLPPNLAGVMEFSKAFAKFLTIYPNIRLQVISTHQPISLLKEKVDILIAPEKYVVDLRNTVGIKLLDFTYHCYAAPSYLKKHGEPKVPADLQKHQCILFRQENQWEFARKNMAVAGSFQSDAGDSIINACILGVGAAYLPDFMVAHEVKKNLLQPVLLKFATKQDQLKIFYIKHQYKARKIAVFIDFLRKHFKDEK
jgi:DNA-binding transcriptional LysR family regulator